VGKLPPSGSGTSLTESVRFAIFVGHALRCVPSNHSVPAGCPRAPASAAVGVAVGVGSGVGDGAGAGPVANVTASTIRSRSQPVRR
jgi:hypothetical protein